MARATLADDNRIHVTTGWDEKELIRLIPGVRHNTDAPRDGFTHWHLPLTWAACLQLAGVFKERLEVDSSLVDWSQVELDQRVAPAMALRGEIDYPGHEAWYPFQRADIAWMITAGDCLLANEPGTGKTISAATTVRTLKLAHGDDTLPMLVISPNSVKQTWDDEITKWFPEATPYRLTGSATKKRKLLKEAAEDPTAFVIINIEAVRLHSRLAPYGSVRLKRCPDCGGPRDPDGEHFTTPNKCEVHPRELNEIAFRTVLVDEAHRIKEPKAKQTRACWAVMHQESVRHRYALTGTPIANHVGDLWSIMHGVAPNEYPTKSAFVDRYALMAWNMQGGMDIVGVNPATRDELFRFLDPRLRRMPKALVLRQLPPKVRLTRTAEMTPKQRKAYQDLEERLCTRLDDGSLVVTTNNLTAKLRLLQLASSYAEIMKEDPEDPTTWVVKLAEPSPKLDVLEEILDEWEGKQIAVCAESRQLIELAAARLEKRGESIVQLTGAVPDYERAANLERFQRGEVRCMLFTVKAGGVGLTMTATDTLVRLQRSWSMIDNKQAEDRVHRIGSERHESVCIIDVIAPDTVEVDQLERLRDKERRLDEIVRDKAAYVAAGYDVATLEAEEMALLGSELSGGRA